MTGELARFASLRDRDLRAEGIMIAEGRLLVERLLSMPEATLLGLLCVPTLAERFERLVAGRCPLSILPEPGIAQIAGFPFHRGILAAAKRPPAGDIAGLLSRIPFEAPSSILLLPETKNPNNLGSLVRSAAAFGFDGLLLGPASADPWSRIALRASMGAVFGIPIVPIIDPGELGGLRTRGFRIIAALIDEGALDFGGWGAPEKAVLALGEEYGGLGQKWREVADEGVRIAMAPGPDSLNVSAAGAVLMQRLSRVPVAGPG
jgi:tRNA G18 (ribose-2'-O)-methylase SpoU